MISAKQAKILAFPYSKYDAIICDGAIRSGKTSIMMVSFVRWAMSTFSGQRFGICGKTVDSTVKNIIVPFMSMTDTKQKYAVKWRRADKVMEVRQGNTVNYFEVFGGKDESSYALIQGRTLAGVMFDEVVLQPESFVNQGMARCSVDGAKIWFSCNPDSPRHWFYLNWIQQHRERNAFYLRFGLEDNPSLSQATLDRYKSMYTGVFYQRYIQGLWVVAEGLVYDFGEDNITDEIPENGEYYISVDYGTQNPFAAGLYCLLGDKATMIAEFYHNGREKGVQLTDEEYCDKIEALAEGYNIRQVVVDPSAASFIAALRKRGYKVRQANNEVLDGIRRTAVYLKNGNIKIHRSCVNAIAEFGLYRWDDKANADKVIKENDHHMDEIRYFANTILKNKVGKTPYRPIFM